MGETVTFTAPAALRHRSQRPRRHAQLIDDDNAAGPDRSGNAYVLTVEKYWLTRQADADVDLDTTLANSDFDRLRSETETKTGSATPWVYFSEAPGRLEVSHSEQSLTDP